MQYCDHNRGPWPPGAHLSKTNQVSISGVIRLPHDSEAISGVLVVAVEDVTFADSGAVVVAEIRRDIRDECWQWTDASLYLSFAIAGIELNKDRSRLVVNARVYRHGDDRLKAGDALTMDAYPLPTDTAEQMVLDLNFI